jgi:sugar (pentulose or hexulose) kinase
MLGDILLAGSAVGVFSDPALDASRFAGSDRTYTPDARRTAHYARYVDIYRGLFDRERELFESLQKIPPYGEETTT